MDDVLLLCEPFQFNVFLSQPYNLGGYALNDWVLVIDLVKSLVKVLLKCKLVSLYVVLDYWVGHSLLELWQYLNFNGCRVTHLIDEVLTLYNH